jgi:NADPH-dependent 2,4-dienoyl-CoA reductase/sulfur reductase-like enzyme
MTDIKPHIAILGAGPTGLEAALAAAEEGFPFTVFDAAPSVAGNVRAWGHVRLFTPWAMNVSPRMCRHLAAVGTEVPDGAECPTGDELAERLFEPLAGLPEIAPNLRLGTRVLGIGREGLLKHEEIATDERGRRPFRLLLTDVTDREWTETADLVIDATGSWGHPNTLGDSGIPAPGERSFAGEIRSDIPDFAREAADWAGRIVLLAGAGHSAQTAARELARLAEEVPGTEVIWLLRNPVPSWGTHPGDPLPERAGLAATAAALAAGASPAVKVKRGAVVEAISKPNGRFHVVLRNGSETPEVVEVDRILSLTGSVGDREIYRQLQVHECYATCGPIKLAGALLGAGSSDCLTQTTHGADTLTNPEPGFFILGSKSYGRNNTFLMRIGWEQVGEVFGLLDGRP